VSNKSLIILRGKRYALGNTAHWLGWCLSCWLLAACSAREEQVTLPLPTGHYEGPVTYQGTDLRVTLDVREPTTGQLQADMRFPEIEGISFPVAKLRYKEPQLNFEQEPSQPGNITVSAIREGDFLRGIFTWDTIQTEFVWARRGQAVERPYREQAVQLTGISAGEGNSLLARFLIPQDTALRYPAVALLPDIATAGAAAARADLLARHGFVVLLVPPLAVANTTDSLGLRLAKAAITVCRAEKSVDSSRVGLWVRGPRAGLAVLGASQLQPPVAFLVIEGVSIQSAAEAKPFQQIARQRIPILGLYGMADTTVQASESAKRLRAAIGSQRRNAVRVYAKANRNLTIAGYTNAKGQWQWPQPAPGYIDELLTWLRQQTTR